MTLEYGVLRLADRPDVWLYGDGSRLARSDRREPTCGQGSRAGVTLEVKF